MSDNGESGGDTINDLLATNEAFSEIVSEASSHREATTDLPAGFAAMVALMTEGVKTAVKEALRANREDAAATLSGAAGPAGTRRATMLAAHDSAEVIYMRSDQRELTHKMKTIREGNVTDLIQLVRTQQLLSEYTSNNHLKSYHWSVAFGPTAKEQIVSFIYTNNAVRSKLPSVIRDVLAASGPSTEAIDAMDSEDLHSIAAYMVRPTTNASALQALRAIAIAGSWQATGMVAQLKARLQAFSQYLTLFEKVHRMVCHNRCKISGVALVDKSSFIRVPIMKKGAHVKTETIEAIMRDAVTTHQLLSGDLFDYIVSPIKGGDKLLSLLNLSLHRSSQLAKTHEPNFVAQEAPDIALMDAAPDIHALCTDQVKPNSDGRKDIRTFLLITQVIANQLFYRNAK